jgi:hypothetical protein
VAHGLGLADRFGHQRLHQVRVSAVGQSKVEIADHGDRHEQFRRQLEGCEHDHRAIRATDHRDRGGFPVVHVKEVDGDGEGQHGAEFAAQREEHALDRTGQQVADIQQHADSHEHQARDQAVGEHERVHRLEKVQADEVEHVLVLSHQRLDDEVAGGPVDLGAGTRLRGRGDGDRREFGVLEGLRVEEQDTRVDRDHAQPHRDHQQRLKGAALSEINQQTPQQDERQAGDRRLPVIGQERADPLEYLIEQLHETRLIPFQSR